MIYYLNFYVPYELRKNRRYTLSSCNKIESILNILYFKNFKINVISCCNSLNDKINKNSISIENDYNLFLLKGYSSNNKILNKLLNIFFKIKLKKYIMNRINSNDIVIVYHSLYYMDIVKELVKKKNIKLIMECEEIYGDVLNNSRIVKKEIETFKYASSYIFPTELLNSKINMDNKPYAIMYGAYNIPQTYKSIFNDDLIHIVYAGTFDPRKGGCLAAVQVAEFLPQGYHIHIIGFGSENDINNICVLIDDVSKKTKCKITYDGLLDGDEYSQFLQSCQIGLSTQNPNASFNDTSFPSKILSYMAHGLDVVSIRIPAIEKSKISKYIHYYDEQTPKEIAEAIMNVKDNHYDTIDVINELSIEFGNDISKIIDNLLK